jgi:mannose-6-phosphate isomerase-like protein (cupin superfamily)
VLEGGPGEAIRELAGLARGNSRRLSLAEVIIGPGGGSLEHYHHHTEEVYYLLKGQAQLTSGGETRMVGAGDTIVIPPGTHHKIVNADEGEVIMLAICAPAWRSEDSVYLE